MENLLIHIGYHKTGSSWQQRHLFSDTYRRFASPLHRRDDVYRHIVAPNPLDFCPDRCRDALSSRLRAAPDTALTPVISAERLSGTPFSGGYDSKELANRLFAVFPKARILIVIREQLSMLVSTYKAYVDKGGTCSIRDFFIPPPRAAGRLPWFDYRHFAYDRLISHYQNLFGPSKVLVLTFEQFRMAPLDFVNRILAFASAATLSELPQSRPENPGMAAFMLPLKRRLNPFLVRDPLNGYSALEVPGLDQVSRAVSSAICNLLPPSVENRSQKRLTAAARSLVLDRYLESNARTASLTGLDLSALEYGLAKG